MKSDSEEAPYQELMDLDRAVAKRIRKHQQLRRLFRVLVVVFVVTALAMVMTASRSADAKRSLVTDIAKTEGRRAAAETLDQEVNRRPGGLSERVADSLVENERFVESIGREVEISPVSYSNFPGYALSGELLDEVSALRQEQAAMTRRLDQVSEMPSEAAVSPRSLDELRTLFTRRFEEQDRRLEEVLQQHEDFTRQLTRLEDHIEALESRMSNLERRPNPSSYRIRPGRSVRIVNESLQISVGKRTDSGHYPVVIRRLDGQQVYPTANHGSGGLAFGDLVEFTAGDARYALLVSHRMPRKLFPDFVGFDLWRVLE